MSTHTQKSGQNMNWKENWQNSGAGDGGRQNMLSGSWVTPKGIPIIVIMIMLGNKLPLKRIIKNVPVNKSPNMNNRDDGVAIVSR